VKRGAKPDKVYLLGRDGGSVVLASTPAAVEQPSCDMLEFRLKERVGLWRIWSWSSSICGSKLWKKRGAAWEVGESVEHRGPSTVGLQYWKQAASWRYWLW